MSGLAVDQVLSGTSLGLASGFSDFLVLEIGGRRVVYALSRSENQLVELSMAGNGTLSLAGTMVVSGIFGPGSEPVLGALPMPGGGQRLTFAGIEPIDGQSVTLTSNGSLGIQASLAGADVLVAPVGATLGATPALLTGRAGAGGLDLLLNSGSGFIWQAGLDDTNDRYLADVAGSAVVTLGSATFVVTVSATENGINVVDSDSESLTQAGVLGMTEGLPVGTPSDLAVLQRLDETLLVVASSGSSSLSVAWLDGVGIPHLADHILDSGDTFFQAASAVAGATYDDFAFVAAGGADGGVSLFTVLPGGRLVHLDSMADDGTTTLYRVSSVELVVSGSALHLLAASLWEPGLTRLSFDLSGLGSVLVADESGAGLTGTGADDQLVGSSVGEVLSGGAGDDILADGAGIDTLLGGVGADLFVMQGDGLEDWILDFDRTADKLDLSGFDFLYDVSQLSVTPTADGAVLAHGSEVIRIVTADSLPLTAGELSNEMILNVDRPPVLPYGQELYGGAGDDTINGAAGTDTILGAGGDDVLLGLGGADSLQGGAGHDTLDGASGDDTLEGQSEDDLLVGGEGSDLITGGGGDDVIYGDSFDWEM